MNELDLFNFTQGLFGTALNGAIAQEVTSAFAGLRPWLHAVAGLSILVTLYLALVQNLPLSRLVSRVLRISIITALVVDGNLYTQWVVRPVTVDLPNAIARAISGGLDAQTVPGQFAAIYRNVEHLSAMLRAQAQGVFYAPDRMMISLAEFAAKLLLVPQYGIYICVTAFLGLAVIAGTIALVFYMFDTTKGFTEAWWSKIVGGLFALFLMSVVLQLIFMMNSRYMQLVGRLTQNGQGTGLNVSEGFDTLFNVAATFCLGLFLMVVAVLIGFGIGRATGFDVATVARRFTGRR